MDVRTPALRTISVDAASLDRTMVDRIAGLLEHDPTGSDVLLDMHLVTAIADDASTTLRDALFWRVHWSKVGCVIASKCVRSALERHGLPAVLSIGSTRAEVVRSMESDHRPLAGPRRLIMGPGPAVA